MREDNLLLSDQKALKKAAKYICNLKEGLCPMVVEKSECNTICSLETVPWQCWLALFRDSATAELHNTES